MPSISAEARPPPRHGGRRLQWRPQATGPNLMPTGLKSSMTHLLSSLDSISATISDLASHTTNDPNYLDAAIHLAANALVTTPPGHVIEVPCFHNLGERLSNSYTLGLSARSILIG